MNINFVINDKSLPAKNKETGFELLLDTFKGMLRYGNSDDRYAIFADEPNLHNCKIAADFTLGDFIQLLGERDEADLQLALYEIEDKTPMLDHLSDDDLEDIANSSFYFPDEAYGGSVDFLGVAWKLDAVCLSLRTDSKWESHEIAFSEYVESAPAKGVTYLKNISSAKHAEILREIYQKDCRLSLAEQLQECSISSEFESWYESLSLELKEKIRDKLILARNKKFQGGKPLFDTLENAENLREIRFSAVQGGAVRIIFGHISDSTYGILIGFIKKSDNDGYTAAIKKAKELIEVLKVAN